MSTESSPTKNPLIQEKKIDFGATLRYYKKHWWWFLISLVGFLGLGKIFLHYKSPVYDIHASIMINQNEDESGGNVGGGLSSLISSFSLGGGGSQNLDDEIYKLRSISNVSDAIRELGINKIYSTRPDIFSRKIVYYDNSPVKIDIPDAVLDTISTATKFNIRISDGGKRTHIKVTQGDETVIDKDVNGLPYMARTPYGSFRIDKTRFYRKGEDLSLKAVVTSPRSMALSMLDETLAVNMFDKKSNAIELLCKDTSKERGRKLLNTLIETYNANSMADRQEQASATATFIEERLLKLYNELENAETKIENYKKDNQIVDAEAEAEYIFKKKEMIESSALELETKSSVLKMVKDFLNSDANKYSLVPFNSDLPEDPISKYNELVLERMKMEGNAKGDNLLLKNINSRVDAMRRNLLTSIDRELASTNIALRDMNRVSGDSKKRMSGIPKMEKDLTALYRDQIVKNQIYAYLLQKREESEVKMSRIMPVGKVIDAAYADEKPSSPKPMAIYAGCFLLGLFVPAFWLYSNKRNYDKGLADKSKKSKENPDSGSTTD